MIRTHRKALAAATGALLMALAPQAQAQSNAAAARPNWPFPASMAPASQPQWIEISIEQISIWNSRRITPPVYGLFGVYAYCETANGSRALAPFGRLPNRLLDVPRSQARASLRDALSFNRGVRRFAYDQNCLSGGGRIAIQFQANLKERRAVAARDFQFGYRSIKLYLDEFPARDQKFNGLKGNEPGQWRVFIDDWAHNPRQPTRIYDVYGSIKLI